MADLRYWQDEGARSELMERGRRLLGHLREQLAERDGVVAIEPESGDWFVGATLGQANDAAYARHPDRWFYFCRLDDPSAEIVLPTW
jgi:hypothetical protein